MDITSSSFIIKVGLHLRVLRPLFFEQSFDVIGQKKNEAIFIGVIWSDCALEKSWNTFNFFSKRALRFYDNLFSKQKWLKPKLRSQWRPALKRVWLNLTHGVCILSWILCSYGKANPIEGFAHWERIRHCPVLSRYQILSHVQFTRCLYL